MILFWVWLIMMIWKGPLAATSANMDVEALMAFRSGLQISNGIESWHVGNSACEWKGVGCDGVGVVVSLSLPNLALKGEISPLIGFLGGLENLNLSNNLLFGKVPPEIWKLNQLKYLDLSRNNFSGYLDPELGDVSSLVKLNFSSNKLRGQVPDTIGNLDGLSEFDVSNNELSGELPQSLARLVSIVALCLQQNNFSGGIVGLFSNNTRWNRMVTLNMSLNSFSGDIPSYLFNLSCLASLDLHSNEFAGRISPDMSSLSKLSYLDMSNNYLRGEIPVELCSLMHLSFLNLSDNMLEGLIPNRGKCSNFTGFSFQSNKGLCGDIVGRSCKLNERKLPPPPSSPHPSSRKYLIMGIIIGVVMIIAILIYCLVRKTRSSHLAFQKFNKSNNYSVSSRENTIPNESLSINLATFERSPLIRFTFSEIIQITENFSKNNIIGDGGFGTVYKVVMPDGKPAVMKRLRKSTTQGHREFLAEMESLGKIKHRNLVPLLGYCSFGDEKVLVSDFMENGSLEMWLKNRAASEAVLDWPKRFKIAIGSTRGLSFLHHGFFPHRDIKTNNILLDANFEPKVDDFGLARLISHCETHVCTLLSGTIGYIPPEYSQIYRSTTEADVYSFGVILMQLLTGKEPTGTFFQEHLNLVGWVHHMIRAGHPDDVLDPLVSASATSSWKLQMLQMLKVATMCTHDHPAQRPTMLEIVKLLKDIEDNAFKG